MRKQATPQRTRRTVLTRTMLLPMPRARADSLSLEYHLALATLHSGEGNIAQAGLLLRTTLLGYFIGREEHDHSDADLFGNAQSALARTFDRVDSGGGWAIAGSDYCAVRDAMLSHDAQLMRIPLHLYDKGSQQTEKFLLRTLPVETRPTTLRAD